MDQYIVVTVNTFDDCRIVRVGDPIPSGHTQIFGPASSNDCKDWIAQYCGGDTEPEPKFIVTALAGGTDGNHESCMIVGDDDHVPGTHDTVFGPDCLAACEEWMAKNGSKSDNANVQKEGGGEVEVKDEG